MRPNRSLFKITKKWGEEPEFGFVWHRNDKVFVRKESGARALLVRVEVGLRKIGLPPEG